MPLNINLGAYSPALVVGDGEISFGGKADVTALMSALEGASVNAQAAAGSGRAPEPAKGTPAVAAGSVPATTPATAVATIPAASSEKTGVDNDPAHKPQLAALQGMGKEIAPRVVKLVKNNSPVKLGRNDGPAVQEIAARDLETLKAALEYSAASLKTGPIVEMGVNTPGMRIKPQGATAVARSIYDEGSHPAPRAVPEEIPNTVAMSKVRTTVTTMYIRGGALNGGKYSSRTTFYVFAAKQGCSNHDITKTLS